MTIKETMDVAKLACEVAVSGKKALADGAISIGDLPLAWGLFQSGQDAVEGADKILGELTSMTEEEKGQILAKVELALAPEFGEKTTAVAKACLQVAFSLVSLWSTLKG